MTEKPVVQKKPGDIRALIMSDAYKQQFATALPKHLKAERFIRIALTAITRTPKLLECTQSSFMKCLLDLSAMGLEPDGRKAHLIPYMNKKMNVMECQLIVDYKGLVDLARRSGEISDIHADVVCEKDQFEYSFGTDGKLVHKPALDKRGNPIAAYSYVRLKDGSSSYEVMSLEEIEVIHGRSKAKDNGPWNTDWNEMAKKTVFRRHSKWLPVSSERLQVAIEKDYDVPIDIKVEPAGKPAVEMPRSKSAPQDPADNEPCTEEQRKTLSSLAEKAGTDKTFEVLSSFKADKIEDLTIGQAKVAIVKLSEVALGK